MHAQLGAIVRTPGFPLPIYLSFVAPLAGTESFWADAERGALAPNLLLRDLDGGTVAYADGCLRSPRRDLTDFADRMSRRPWTLMGWRHVLYSLAHRVLKSGRFDPLHWLVLIGSSLHCYAWSLSAPPARATYFAGEDTLDPQYSEYPNDISVDDRERYFEPIRMTDGEGRLADWLQDVRRHGAAAPAGQARSSTAKPLTTESGTDSSILPAGEEGAITE